MSMAVGFREHQETYLELVLKVVNVDRKRLLNHCGYRSSVRNVAIAQTFTE